jgi:predicted nucleotidyltransferase
MTQAQLAERTGVRQPNIAAYETARRVPSPSMLERLLEAALPRASAVLQAHRADVIRIAERYHAVEVRVFGSIAHGDDTSDSDVDLLVRFQDGADIFDQAALIEELEDLLQRHVDVVSERALKECDTHIRDEAVPL